MRGAKNFLSFREARALARKLGLKNSIAYLALKKTKKYPELPSTPHYIYKKTGWTNWGDFLGTGNVASFNREFLPYEKARAIVRRAKLTNNKEWLEWGRNKRPNNVPLFPNNVYKDSGWVSWSDWLGPHYKNPKNRFRPYEKAMAYARRHKIKTMKQWKTHLEKNNIPDLPKSPHAIYLNKGWVSWPVFLNTRHYASSRTLLPYTKAKNIVRKWKLSTLKEYQAYLKKHGPENIPAYPNLYYKDKGWVDWFEWLGKKRKGV